MNVTYRPFRSADRPVVGEFMKDLYRHDPADLGMDDAKVDRTFEAFSRVPERGTIMVFDSEGQTIGYGILVNFWSNEYSGNLVSIDELYVSEPFRGQGVATDFIQRVIKNEFLPAVAVDLEVTPANAKARALYEKLGFKPWKNTAMRWAEGY